MSTRLTLTAAVGSRAWREGLAAAQTEAQDFALNFVDVSPIHRAFAPMARDQTFDVSEMALTTYLTAREAHKLAVKLDNANLATPN